MASPTRRQLHALTGLRFLAALHVVVLHVVRPALRGAPEWAANLAATGYVGVSLFFVLSGFILTYTYTDARGAFTAQPPRFWVARIARVYPVYLLGLLVSLPFFLHWVSHRVAVDGALIGATKGGVVAGADLLLLQSWWSPIAAVWNFPSWSLSCEAVFYLLFPFAAVPLARLPRRRLALVAVGLYAALLVPPLLYLAVRPDGAVPATVDSGALWLTVLKFQPLLRLPEFLLGIVVGRLYMTRASDRPRRAAALSTGAALVLLLVLTDSAHIPYPLLHNGLLAPLFALLIYGLADGSGALARALGSSWLVLLGEASYALYILHIPLGLWRDALAGELPALAGLQPLAAATLFVAVAVLVAVLVLRGFEEPARRAIRAMLDGRRRVESTIPEIAA